MKVLVIPDVHLKAWMFERAEELMKNGTADRVVCLMDIPDDWNKRFQTHLYVKAFDTAIKFAKMFPDTMWCYGNHDLCYLWNQRESGYSPFAESTVVSKLLELHRAVLDDNTIKYVQKIDNVLFSHAGLTYGYVQRFVPRAKRDNIEDVLEAVNDFNLDEIWNGFSPVWTRQLQKRERMFKPKDYLQVVGHTPVERLTKDKNVIFCDTFSTYRDGTPIGTQEFLLIDTITKEYTGIK